MLATLFSKVKLHAPPTTLVVAILAWLFGSRVSGATLQEIGQLVTCVLAGTFAPSTVAAVSSAARNIAGKVGASAQKSSG